MRILAIILLTAVAAQQSHAAAISITPKTTDDLVDYVLTNKFYYFDAKAPEMEAELEEMLEQIHLAKSKFANDSDKVKIYDVAQHYAEKYLEVFRRHKYRCGVKNVFHFMAPPVTASMLTTEDENVAIHWYKHFKMFTDDMKNYEKSIDETHDVIEEFTKGNRNLKKEYSDKYTQKANEKCDLKVFMTEIH